MDWQTLLVRDGQTIVISTGTVVGFIALVIYRTRARWGMYTEDKEHKREELHRAQAWVRGETK